jgi:hypothetical protein
MKFQPQKKLKELLIKLWRKFNGGLFGNFSNALFDICLILQGVWVGKDF